MFWSAHLEVPEDAFQLLVLLEQLFEFRGQHDVGNEERGRLPPVAVVGVFVDCG